MPSPNITCTNNITVSNDLGVCGATVNYPSPTVTDECPLGFSVSCTPPSGSFFPIGTTIVTCTVTDLCGGTATCSFTVTVVDNKPSNICCCDCCCNCCCNSHSDSRRDFLLQFLLRLLFINLKK
ncbi:HYR domain-containing protein [Priestia megaterium]|uniref:HYR domain-containing protein n=1 Tax=Priestia megaterium TaxID=1404 RepID=UPI00387A1278